MLSKPGESGGGGAQVSPGAAVTGVARARNVTRYNTLGRRTGFAAAIIATLMETAGGSGQDPTTAVVSSSFLPFFFAFFPATSVTEDSPT